MADHRLHLIRTWLGPLRFDTLVEVTMGKLALFLGGFLILTLLIGLLGTIPPG
ncbi:hypothetical protein [Pseudomonas entomophila]|uniref:hypothetical protein n=1 Tax=Pseudomonas entomophila TaxID=312306 RepID=UPI003EBC0E0A